MFGKLKKPKQLNQLAQILSQQEIKIEKQGIRIVMDGRMEIKQINLNPKLSQKQQEQILKDCLNQAIKEAQLITAKVVSKKVPDFKI